MQQRHAVPRMVWPCTRGQRLAPQVRQFLIFSDTKTDFTGVCWREMALQLWHPDFLCFFSNSPSSHNSFLPSLCKIREIGLATSTEEKSEKNTRNKEPKVERATEASNASQNSLLTEYPDTGRQVDFRAALIER